MKSSLLGLFMAGCLSACSLTHDCTEIGCQDSLTLTLVTADNHWEEGSYEFTLTVGDQISTCTLQLPEELPATDGPVTLTCDSLEGYEAPVFSQLFTCEETRSEDSVSESCTPVPDEYSLTVTVSGTPSSVDVRLEKDDVSLVDRTLTLAYEEFQPNGSDCPPICQQAHEVIEIP